MSERVKSLIDELAKDIQATVRGAYAIDGRGGPRDVAAMLDGELAAVREQLRTGEFRRKEEKKP